VIRTENRRSPQTADLNESMWLYVVKYPGREGSRSSNERAVNAGVTAVSGGGLVRGPHLNSPILVVIDPKDAEEFGR
jgi:hypothetical protein